MKRLLFYGLFAILWANASRAQNTREEIEKQKAETQSEIDYANQILEETRGRREASLNDLSVISHLLERREELISELENESALLVGSIADNQREIARIEENLMTIKAHYEGMIISAFKNRRKTYFLMHLLASENMYQAYKRMRYYKFYSDFQKTLSNDLSRMNNELLVANEALEQMIEVKNSTIQDAARETQQMNREIGEKNGIIAQLERREKELMEEISRKENIANRLEAELTAFIEEERRRADNAALIETLTPAERIISDEFEQNKGRLPWPTDRGIITGKYGEHEYKDYKRLIIRNDGIYISTVPGEEVRAIFRGKVSKVFAIPGENYSVMLQHGEYFTVYQSISTVYQLPLF